jgi:predicted TIM-barrel fold metal-dependent hydrolase
MRTITLEEHFVSQAFLELAGVDLGPQMAVDLSAATVIDLGEQRLADMDAAGIDVQVLSHVLPTFTQITVENQIAITSRANDQAAEAVAAHPDRFAAFAALPLGDAAAAVRELDRAVADLGCKGALINGRENGRFLDDPALFPILARAAALRVPLYLHPGLPTDAIRREYYSGLPTEIAYALSAPAWGWHAETGLHLLRLIATGTFDRLPDLQIIIGHMGEMVPFMLDRIDAYLSPPARRNGLQHSIADTFRNNVWVTTSGMFTSGPLDLLIEVLGIDRVLFSVDYPFCTTTQGRDFLDSLALSPDELAKLSHRNAETLLRLTPVPNSTTTTTTREMEIQS